MAGFRTKPLLEVFGNTVLEIEKSDSLKYDRLKFVSAGVSAGDVLTYNGTDFEFAAPTPGATTLIVNSTPITSGTVGRVLFQGTGNVLQQSANLFWNNTDSRLNIGGVGTANGRLTILSPATTGLALHIRNSADTTNQLEFNGDARLSIFNATNSNGLYFVNGGSSGSGYLIGSSPVASGTNKFIVISPGSLQFFDTASGARTVFAFNNSPTGNLTLDNNADRFRVTHSTWSSHAIESANGCLALQDSNARRPTSGARCVLMVTNGTKSTDTTDTFQLIAKDIVAGNAAPHFYTENGNEIKIYRETTSVAAAALVTNLGTPITNTCTFDGYTLQQIVKALRNFGQLA
jgi:hypothetical protein